MLYIFFRNNISIELHFSEIVVIGLDSVLYRIGPDSDGRIESAHIDAFDFGYMETWNCVIDDSARTCLTSMYT